MISMALLRDVPLLLATVLRLSLPPVSAPIPALPVLLSVGLSTLAAAGATAAPVTNFTAAIQRMVTLLALSGSGLLAFVWARVALSWFSNDVAKKVQAKDRARDALIGTILFSAAISGLLWGLAQWVVTGA